MSENTNVDGYRFAIDYLDPEGAPIGTLVCEPDWDPAREWLQHLALRQALPQESAARASLAATPVWNETLGPPICSAIRLSLGEGGEPVAFDVPPDYFQGVAETNARRLIDDGKLERGSRFLFHVSAFPLAASARRRSGRAPEPANDFQVEALPEPLPIADEALAPRLANARPRGDQQQDDALVFIPGPVLEQVTEAARRAGELESGSLLAGRLCRCPDSQQFFVEVTAAIPAEYAEADTGSFTFTPETWAAGDRTLRLRARDELFVGWCHSHPQFCRQCPNERRRVCAFSRPAFSLDDRHLHRTCFPLGHQIALLISDLPERGSVASLYGWRRGMIAERGYHEANR